MTSHLNSHRTTDIKPEMLSGVQTGNGTPHDKYNIRGIAHARTNRKDNIFMQRQLYIDEAHTALNIWSNFMRMHIDKKLCHFFMVNLSSLLTLIFIEIAWGLFLLLKFKFLVDN